MPSDSDIALDARPVQKAEAELAARVEALRPLLREQAGRGETDRVVPAQIIEALGEAGVFRLLTPKRYGGLETDLRTLTEVSETLGTADGSSAWTGMIIAVTNWLACLFPDKAQEDVFGADPDARVTGVAAPTGMGEKVPGGWRVSGRWSYNSGAPYATWAAVGALLKDDHGAVVDQALVLIPAGDLTIEDTWHMAGMKGTASNTLIARDVFVPEYRALSVPATAEGARVRSRPEEALYGSTFGPMLLLCLMGPLLGLGRAALDIVLEAAAAKPLSFTTHARQADSVGVQMQVAEAALKLETARLHTYQAVDAVDRAAPVAPLDYAARAHIRAQAGYAAQQVLEAIGILLNAHGSSAFAETHPLQRIWRDANVAARHAGLIPAVGLEVYGKSLLDVDERVSLMV
ncbi:acyl-CoA dehydrogenase family protein [Streptomyces chromofuscus]|uniref:Acyl-CoA dehydrogenase family protein n=1 Tax=Streptomyces chromofuscus TaxID=42881 RepID=A0A7M2T6J1_STRCW|nr:acyl-CoA dehydrogenase family protein [Streptomyces chromofuscus]QOV43523.1 acyl-CoA dehydrogenase family protein [Streptomyces chromofuscus]GGT10200.1 acyl-CoA dehydrogenase [Streptomyces chromofuscus]